jgi:hypothetical protein
MSYEPLKAQGSNPPGYRYGQQAAVSSRYGTVATVAQQDHEARSVQQQDLPETVSTFGGQQSEMCDDPYGVPVAQLNLDFKECFHEHESTRTIGIYYKAMDFTYKYVKLIVYHFLVFTLGIIFAILFAVLNAVLAFVHVWIYGPFLKIVLMWIYALAPFVTAPLRAIHLPLVDVSARFFRQFRLQAHISGPIPEYIISKARSNV